MDQEALIYIAPTKKGASVKSDSIERMGEEN